MPARKVSSEQKDTAHTDLKKKPLPKVTTRSHSPSRIDRSATKQYIQNMHNHVLSIVSKWYSGSHKGVITSNKVITGGQITGNVTVSVCSLRLSRIQARSYRCPPDVNYWSFAHLAGGREQTAIGQTNASDVVIMSREEDLLVRGKIVDDS